MDYFASFRPSRNIELSFFSFLYSFRSKYGFSVEAAFLCVLLFCSTAFSQQIERVSRDRIFVGEEYIVRNWSTDNGLPQNSIDGLGQTPDGFIWLATDDGIARFDGYRFEQFRVANTPGLAYDRYNRLFVDSKGVVWFATENGFITRYEEKRFISFQLIRDAYMVTDFAENSAGEVYISTNDSIALYKYHNRTFVPAVHSADINYFRTEKIVFDKNDNLYIGTSTALFLYDGHTTTKIDERKDFHYAAILPRADGSFLVGGGGILILKDGKTSDFPVPLDMKGKYLRALEYDSKGRLWAAGFFGLYRLENNSWIDVLAENDISSNLLTSLLFDPDGNIWAGTFNTGVNLLSRRIIKVYSQNDGIGSESVTAVYAARDGTILVGNNCGGFNAIKNGVVTHYNDEVNGPCVWTILEDRSGTIWTGLYGANGLEFWKNDKSIEFPEAKNLPERIVLSLFQDSEDNIWIGTIIGVMIYTPDKKLLNGKDFGIPALSASTFFEDSNHRIWIASYQELGYVENNRYNTFVSSAGKKIIFPRSVYEDKENLLWVGTYGHGLFRIANNNSVTQYTIDTGLFDNVVSCILEDKNGHLWFTGNKGLSSIEKIDLNDFAEGKIERISYVSFGKNEGLLSDEFNGGFQPSGSIDSLGRFWFPTIKGVAVFHPDSLARTSLHKNVSMLGVELNRTYFPIHENIPFSYNDSRIDFHFTSIFFNDPSKVTFMVKLEGYEEKWSNPIKERNVSYTNLPPGSYTFRVRAIYYNNRKEYVETAYSFTIPTPFWESWWFRAITIGLFVLVLYLLYKNRLRNIEKQHRELEERVQQRTSELREAILSLQSSESKLLKANNEKDIFFQIISHDLKNPISAIMGFSEILADDAELTQNERVFHVQLLNRSARALYELLDNLLNWTRIESGKLTVRPVNLPVKRMFTRTFNLQEMSALNKGIALHAAADESLTVYADEDMLYTVLRNLTSNALKYTEEGGTISLVARQTGSAVQFTVSDTGVGMTEEQISLLFTHNSVISTKGTGQEVGTGLGLFLCKEMIERNSGAISVTSKLGEGTVFTFTLPAKLPKEEKR